MSQATGLRYTLKEAATRVGVAPITLKRWLLNGKVDEVARDRNGWRTFSDADIARIRHYALTLHDPRKR
jgi:DNA (cytosine-5)-methyltransferase 1